MTPTAVTPAATRKPRSHRAAPAKPRPGSDAPAPARRPSSVRSGSAPVSPPAAGRTPAARAASVSAPAAARTSSARSATHRAPAPARRPPATKLPRRSSGPARPRPAGAAPKPATGAARIPLGRRATALVRSLPEHSLLDRVIRGRIWIPLLGVMLVGIVAMQVEVLKLNASIGRSLERSTTLQGRNDLLRTTVSRLSDDQRIESEAAHMGLVMAPPASVRFLAPGGPANVEAALGGIHAPGSVYFASPVGTASSAAAAAATGASSPLTSSQ